MTALKGKDGDLLSHFDKIDKFQPEIDKTTPKHNIVSKHDIPANEGKRKGQLPLKHILGFCRTFK